MPDCRCWLNEIKLEFKTLNSVYFINPAINRQIYNIPNRINIVTIFLISLAYLLIDSGHSISLIQSCLIHQIHSLRQNTLNLVESDWIMKWCPVIKLSFQIGSMLCYLVLIIVNQNEVKGLLKLRKDRSIEWNGYNFDIL